MSLLKNVKGKGSLEGDNDGGIPSTRIEFMKSLLDFCGHSLRLRRTAVKWSRTRVVTVSDVEKKKF